MITDRIGAERFAGRGRRVERAEPSLYVLAGYRPDGTSPEEGENLPAKVDAIRPESSRFPAAAVSGEDFLGELLEQDFAGIFRVGLAAVPKGGQHRAGAGACLRLGHGLCVGHRLPDPSAPMLAVDEVALGAGWHHPDAVPLELGVPDVVDGAARRKRVDPTLGEAYSCHE